MKIEEAARKMVPGATRNEGTSEPCSSQFQPPCYPRRVYEITDDNVSIFSRSPRVWVHVRSRCARVYAPRPRSLGANFRVFNPRTVCWPDTVPVYTPVRPTKFWHRMPLNRRTALPGIAVESTGIGSEGEAKWVKASEKSRSIEEDWESMIIY